MNVVKSLARDKKKTIWKQNEPLNGRDTVSRALSTSSIRDRVKSGKTHFIHNHSNPPPVDTVLRRAPRSLGSALCLSIHDTIRNQVFERLNTHCESPLSLKADCWGQLKSISCVYFTVQKLGVSTIKKGMLCLFSKDALHWSKLTEKF